MSHIPTLTPLWRQRQHTRMRHGNCDVIETKKNNVHSSVSSNAGDSDDTAAIVAIIGRHSWLWYRWFRRQPKLVERRVVFNVDESRFELLRWNGRMRGYRRRGQRYHRYASANVQEIGRPVLYGGGSRMVWCTIRFGWKCCLAVVDGNLTAQRYIDVIFRNDVTPHFASIPNDVFMQDIARPHSARITQRYLQDNNVNTPPRPPYTPGYWIVTASSWCVCTFWAFSTPSPANTAISYGLGMLFMQKLMPSGCILKRLMSTNTMIA